MDKIRYMAYDLCCSGLDARYRICDGTDASCLRLITACLKLAG